MKFTYLHIDGTGKAFDCNDKQWLSEQDFCKKVFGELERPLAIGEQISAATGAIEPIPTTAKEIEQKTETDAAKAELGKVFTLSVKDFQAMGTDQLGEIVFQLVRMEARRLGIEGLTDAGPRPAIVSPVI